MIFLSGLTSVGQDEVVILLEVEEGETLPPRDVFTMLQVRASLSYRIFPSSYTFQALYEQAGAGNPVTEMGHVSVGSNYLGKIILYYLI